MTRYVATIVPQAATVTTIYQNSYNVHPNRASSYAGPTFWDRSPPIDWDQLLRDVNRLLHQVPCSPPGD